MSLSTASIHLVLSLPLSCLCPQHPSTLSSVFLFHVSVHSIHPLSSVFLFHVSVHSIHPPCPWSSSFMSLSTASIHLVLCLPLSCLCPQHPSTLSLVFLFHVSVHSIHPPCPRSSSFMSLSTASIPCPRSSSFMSLSTASIHLVLSLPLSCLCPQHPSTLSSVFLFHVSVHSIHPPCPWSSSSFMSLFTASIHLVLGLPLSCLCPQHPSTLSSVFLFHVSVHSIHPPCPRSSSFMSLSTASIHLVLGLPLSCLCPQHPSTLSSVFLFHVSVHSIHPPCHWSSSFMSLFIASIHLVRGLPLSCLCP